MHRGSQHDTSPETPKRPTAAENGLSRSPYLSPARALRRREQRMRRRRGRAAFFAAFALAVIAVLLASTGLSTSKVHGSAAHGGARTSHASAAAVSPIGLPLGKPPFALYGLGTPAADPVQLAFRSPPRAGLLFNLSTGQVLWQRNADKRVRIASLTKMMTALLTVQSAPPQARVLVTREAVETPGSKVGVLPLGRRVRLESMLYGLLLPSGNDAAVALAQRVAGNVGAFVAEMNAKAAALGLGCTRYSSPSGFYDEGNFSCAADLAVLAHVDLEQPRIARIVRTASAALPFPIQGGKLFLYNNNPLLIYHYPGLTGMKTGYTLAAGKCLVASAERDGVRLGVIVLRSPDPATQASELLNSGFYGVYHLPPLAQPPIPPEA